MAFRTGFHVGTLAERLYSPSRGSEPWTFILPGVQESDAKAAIAKFHESNVSITPISYLFGFERANN
jgi:hypothetical protein